MKTIEQRLTECGNIGPGLDLLRITLAFGVLAWHTVTIFAGNPAAAKASFVWPFAFSILLLFFALSGFLVTASALRLPLREYILNRSFRIVPALAVDIFFAALIPGPIVTTFALGNYVQDAEFRRYFLNIIGWIHYRLPGVFLDNPNPGIVNGALWAVPYEIGCYVIMSLMIHLGLLRSWIISFTLVIAITMTAVLLYLANFQSSIGFVNQFLNFAFLSKGTSLIPCFLAGSVIYLAKSFLPWDWRIAAAIVAGLVALSLFGPSSWFGSPAFITATVIPLSYIFV
jgi:peptidoglycan/LPS O-acetylase OafA/YrhL